MATTQQQAPPPIAFFGIQGRDGGSPVFAIPPNRCIEAKNVDWFRSSLARRRGGSAFIDITGGTAFSNGVRSLFRNVPGDDQAAAEMWAFDGSGLVKRLTGGTAWANVTLDDAVSVTTREVNAIGLNKKFYLAYATGINRLHVWDPVDAKVRRVGVACGTNPPTSAVAGAGAVTDTRTYKVQFLVQIGGVTVRQSNLTPASTPALALAAQNATVTRPTTPATEGITHWRCFAAGMDGSYRLIVDNIAIATTTATDSTAVLSGSPPPDAGAYTPPPSAKYVVVDDTRVIMAGANETATGDAMLPTPFRIWWTSRLGSSDIGDDERISNTSLIKSYDDIEEAVTALSPPIQGSYYAFSYDGQWKFTGTGNVSAAYTKLKVTGGAGCIAHKTIVMAEDEDGDPALYWLSKRGPVRVGKSGQQYLDQDIADIWDTVNLDAAIPSHAVYHADLRQIWFWIATGSNDYPNIKLVFDTRLGRLQSGPDSGTSVRNGWSQADGSQGSAYCSCMFSQTLAASMSRKLKPYSGVGDVTAIFVCDTTDKNDGGNGFVSYVESRPFAPWGLGNKGGILGDSVLVSSVAVASDIIAIVVIVDEGAWSTSTSISITATSDAGLEVRVFPKVSPHVAQASSMRFKLFDGSNNSQWNLSAFIVPVEYEGTR